VVICVARKPKYFSKWGWTGKSLICLAVANHWCSRTGVMELSEVSRADRDVRRTSASNAGHSCGDQARKDYARESFLANLTGSMGDALASQTSTMASVLGRPYQPRGGL